MQVEQTRWMQGKGWIPAPPGQLGAKAQKVGFGSLGGWDAFGPERLVTRSAGNILYELDDQPALALYKKYLGEYARDLPASGLLISCVGRKLVLKQRIEEEVEGVQDVLGQGTVLAGFYSYGEISPFNPAAKCELHNQTMTITTLSES